jgi:hypothetical protein
MIFNCWQQQPKFPPGCRRFWQRELRYLPAQLLNERNYTGLQAYYFQMLEDQ